MNITQIPFLRKVYSTSFIILAYGLSMTIYEYERYYCDYISVLPVISGISEQSEALQ